MIGFQYKSVLFLTAMLLTSSTAWTQQAGIARATTMNSTVPTLIQFAGTLTDFNGKPLTGVVGVTFALYASEQAVSPLWIETQNVTPDKTGRYSVQLGATRSLGLPSDVFIAGEARWLGVQPEGQSEYPRVMLLSVPYAMKAQDAQTLGGLPPSAFVLAAPPTPTGTTGPSALSAADSASAPPPASSNVTTTGGTANTIPLFTTATNIQNSILTQTAATAINVGGKLNFPATGVATATAGKNSQPETHVASAFNSGTKAALAQTFQLQAEPAGNNTSTPSGTLNLLFGSGTTAPAETGLKISSKGLITFAGGQTFPGTGKGSVTSVGLSAPASDLTVTDSPVTTSGTLKIAWTVPPDANNTANAIVKRDSSGSFNASDITASGQITVNNGSSLNPIISTATAANAAAIDGFSTGTGVTSGVLGSTTSSSAGASGVVGIDQNTTTAFFTSGVTGSTSNPVGNGVYGVAGASQTGKVAVQPTGVWGDSSSGVAVIGSSDSGTALEGDTLNANALVASNASSGTPSNNNATLDVFNNAGDAQFVLYARNNSASAYVRTDNLGDLAATGSVSAPAKLLQIDHPLDPANKYLYHTSVESPDMMNIYNGVVVLDDNGEAWVQLPDYCEALNQDFRYQLTTIGAPALVYIADEISGNRFRVAGGKPGMKVSWQVTGIRHDAWANAHRSPVEVEKTQAEKGRYLHPDAFGLGPERSVSYSEAANRRRFPSIGGGQKNQTGTVKVK